MDQFAEYRVDPEIFWTAARLRGIDGTEIAEVAEDPRRGWKCIYDWGRDGYDLGQCPYVQVYHREREGQYDAAVYVEGDIYAYRFPTRELLDSWTDDQAFYYWKAQERDWVAGYESVDQLPAEFRGPVRFMTATAPAAPADSDLGL